MANVDDTVLEMPVSPADGLMPAYHLVADWLRAETAGLSDEQLDLADHSPEREWMWWSIRQQVSHIAWDALVFTHRRCSHLLWPQGDIPEPIPWADLHLGPHAKADRLLEDPPHHDLADLFGYVDLGLGWLARLVADQPIEALRADVASVRATYFWQYVITTLPRGAGPDPDRPGFLRYQLEASLWMVFYETLAHVRTVQRLKAHQGLPLALTIPRVGYLRLPEYWGETDANGPSMRRIPVPSAG